MTIDLEVLTFPSKKTAFLINPQAFHLGANFEAFGSTTAQVH